MKTIHAIRSKRVVTPEGVRAATVHFRNGVISAVGDYSDLLSSKHIYDAGESVVMPGLVDTHVHINEPGRADWEGFDTATRAAAAGGVTTLIDMPLNSIPATTTLAALDAKRKAALKKCWVNVGFWGGVVPGQCRRIAQVFPALACSDSNVFLCRRACRNLKMWMKAILRAALPKLAALECSTAGPCGTSRPYRRRSREAREGQSEEIRNVVTVAAARRGNRGHRDDDSTCARIQSAGPYRSRIV